MKKLYHLPGWLLLRLCWPLFSNNHSWKLRRGYINYKCFSLHEWYVFVRRDMNPFEKMMQTFVVDGGFWAITIWLIIILTLKFMVS